MPVRRERGLPIEVLAPGGRRLREGQPQPYVGSLEDPVRRVLQELRERPPRLGIGQGEGRREVVHQATTDLIGLQAGQQLGHGDASSQSVR